MIFSSYDNNLLPIDLEVEWQQQRSFLFGDGHFTTAKVEQGKVVWLPEHINRLKFANEKLKFAPINWNVLFDVVESKARGIVDGIIKVQISRGKSVRGYQISEEMRPSLFIFELTQHMPAVRDLKQPIELQLLATQLGLNPQLAGIKHCNRLEQAMIACELKERKLNDGLVTNINGLVIESSKANVFWHDGTHWNTPSLSHSGIDGVGKSVIEKSLPMLKVSDTDYETIAEKAKSMFLCNSITGIIPVAKLNGKNLDMADVKELHLKVFNE